MVPAIFLAVVLHVHIAYAELSLHMLVTAVGRDHVRQLAQRQHVVERHLFARQHLRGRPHADTGSWNTQNTFDPSELTQSDTRLLSPLMTEEMEITVATPITMPRIVSPERILFVRSVSSAIFTDSRVCPVGFMISSEFNSSQFTDRSAACLTES